MFKYRSYCLWNNTQYLHPLYLEQHMHAHTNVHHGALGCLGALCGTLWCWGRTFNRWCQLPPRIVMFNCLCPIYTFEMDEEDRERGQWEKWYKWKQGLKRYMECIFFLSFLLFVTFLIITWILFLLFRSCVHFSVPVSAFFFPLHPLSYTAPMDLCLRSAIIRACWGQL